jgi:hypothetical protein
LRARGLRRATGPCFGPQRGYNASQCRAWVVVGFFAMTEQRLGDLIDDYCPRCKLLLNHAVASIMEDQVVKVICKTCYTEHAYRRGEGGKKKAPAGVTLFDQVLANAAPAADEPPPAATPKEQPSSKAKRTAEPARYISRHPAPRKK